MPTAKNVMPMAKLPTESVGNPDMNWPVVQPPPASAPSMRRTPPAKAATARLFKPEGKAAAHRGVTAALPKLPDRSALAAAPGKSPTTIAARQAVVSSNIATLFMERPHGLAREAVSAATPPDIPRDWPCRGAVR